MLSIKFASSFKGKAETFKDLFVQQCQSIVNDSMVSTNGITTHTKDWEFFDTGCGKSLKLIDSLNPNKANGTMPFLHGYWFM